MLRRYEGFIILNVTDKEDDIKSAIDKVQKEIESVGGRVDKVQPMEHRQFARGGGKQSAGFYVNYLFDAPSTAIAQLDARFHLDPSVFRWQFTEFIEPKLRDKKKKKKAKVESASAPARE